MKVRIGDIEFDRVSYDEEVDVLYLHVGDPHSATHFDASAEGHALRYDHLDRLVGITVLYPRALVADQGRVVITTPDARVEVGADDLADAIASPAT